MIIRLSQKLCTKVKAGKLLELPLADEPTLDWSTQSFVVGRTQFILISNTKSLYSCVIPSKGVASTKHLLTQFHQSVPHQLNKDDLGKAAAKLMSIKLEDVQFAKSLNRSVIGSMNELIVMATTVMSIRTVTLPELNDELNDQLLTILGTKKGGYGKPKEVMAELNRS